MSPEDFDIWSQLRADLSEIKSDTKYTSEKVKAFCTFKDSAAIELERLKNQADSHKDLPPRVAALERWATYRDGALAILLLLVGTGRLIDLYNLIVGR